MARDRWPSKTIFIYAAIGSAVGLGNVWRFPFLAEKFGGGAFLIPYLIALFVAGIPLLILEIGLGQKIQKGAVDSLASIRKKFSGLGWWALFTSFIVISYYAVIMAWSLIYFLVSFGTQWSDDPESYFFNNVLQLSDSVGSIGSIVPAIFIALAVSWIVIYFSVWKGVKSVSKIVLITVPLPIILLVVLLIRAVTLDGAMVGITEFLTPDFNALADSEVWIAAFSQIFFSLSLAFGIMIAYSSYKKKDEDVTKSSFTIGISNSIVSIIAGFVVFGTLGFMAQQQGVDFSEVVASGPGLAFIAFPQALSLMPYASFFSLLFFLTLITLAIDSAFSLVEAINITVLDKTKVKKEHIALIVCGLAFLLGIIYTTNSGLYLLDIVDHFVTNISLIVIGILECIAVGWILGAEKLRKYINKVSDIKIGKWWNISIRYVVPISLSIILGLQLRTEFIKNYGGYPDWAIAIGWAAVVIPLALAYVIPQKTVKVSN
jgi:neurotransmitter:Na+ symporter, NSS family